MCNLYSLTKGPSTILEFTRALRSEVGNLKLLPGIFPDIAAPVVRTGADGTRELVRARWGVPTPRSTSMVPMVRPSFGRRE
ncbi:hypothetical protein GCM10011390_21910 [Aureimonas endophytica]|uniref:SOS response associated peptidase (SRAP) n=1 Tax=Aureimonas endophytica TaxID=2027858 RepID=A0A916ZKW4_9HYPH|nr:hypothetical protein GCM10011390_21910 [Aureimonas endophytica]